MSYDENVRGWVRLARPLDLETATLPAVDSFPFDEPPGQRWWACATGRRRDHVLFAADAKGQSNFYVALLRSMTAAAGGGTGLMVSTGEITGDGRDRLVVVRGTAVMSLPIDRLYDPRSPWQPVYEASHYMQHEPRSPVDLVRVRSALAGRSDVHGWLTVPYGDGRDVGERAADAGRLIVDAASELAGGLDAAFAREHVLIGQDGVDAAGVVTAVAAATAAHAGSYAVLYCGTPADGFRSQVPVAVEAGGAMVLAAVSTDPADDPAAAPARTDAYAGVWGKAQRTVWIRSSLGTGKLAAQVRQTLGGAVDDGDVDGVRSTDAWGRPGFLFTADGLTLTLTANENFVAGPDPVAWPYLLHGYLTHEADPDRLSDRVARAVGRLRARGIECTEESR